MGLADKQDADALFSKVCRAIMHRPPEGGICGLLAAMRSAYDALAPREREV